MSPRPLPLLHPLRVASFCVAVLVGIGVAQAQDPKPSQIEDLSPIVARVLGEHDVPALGGALVVDGKLVGVGVAGVRARGHDAKVSADDRWHLGSCTKAMTATLCARLVQRGELSWDATLEEAFPEIEVHEDLAEATLRQLLSHRSGLMANPLPVWMALRTHKGPVTAARAMLVQKMLPLRPPALSGTVFEYSNTGYMVVGAWLEQAFGKPWEDLLREEVFVPLHMESAGFGPPGVVADGRASQDEDAEVLQPWGHGADSTAIPPGPLADNPPALGPAGTVHCTLADWARFLSAHFEPCDEASDASKPYLTSEALTALHTPPEFDKATGGYALGFGVSPVSWAAEPVLQHAGSNTMWFCLQEVVPGERFAVLVTCNSGEAGARDACAALTEALRVHAGKK